MFHQAVTRIGKSDKLSPASPRTFSGAHRWQLSARVSVRCSANCLEVHTLTGMGTQANTLCTLLQSHLIRACLQTSAGRQAVNDAQ